MRIRWTLAAAADLEHIKDYLTEHYPHLMQSTVLELYETIRSLKALPHTGRLGREEGTRELAAYRILRHTESKTRPSKSCISTTPLSSGSSYKSARELRQLMSPIG
jgi:plasmid stabilization system protein ParE